MISPGRAVARRAGERLCRGTREAPDLSGSGPRTMLPAEGERSAAGRPGQGLAMHHPAPSECALESGSAGDAPAGPPRQGGQPRRQSPLANSLPAAARGFVDRLVALKLLDAGIVETFLRERTGRLGEYTT